MRTASELVTITKFRQVQIPIYAFREDEYQARFYDENGARQRWTSRDLEKLTARCNAKAKQMQEGTVDLDDLTPDQKAICREVLRRDITLTDLDRLKGMPKSITAADAVEKFLAAKKSSAGRSERHWRTLSGILGGMLKSVGAKKNLGVITPIEIDKWLAKAKTPRTRKNWRASATNLFRWCQEKEMLLQDRRTAAERSDKVKVEVGTVVIWTPQELKTMLETVRADYLPWLVIQAFAGVRTSELFPEQRHGSTKEPLKWENVKLDREDPFIEIPANCSKTDERRLIPICDTLKSWLESIHKGTGRVCPAKSPSCRNHKESTVIEQLKTAIGGDWKSNALRHSFGSYRTAQTKNLGEVSLEMGNSVPTIKRHYHEYVTPKEAEQWFALSPAKIDRSLRASA